MSAVNPRDTWHSIINLTENNQSQTVGRNRSRSEHRWAYPHSYAWRNWQKSQKLSFMTAAFRQRFDTLTCKVRTTNLPLGPTFWAKAHVRHIVPLV